jgi:NarL family two-component system sensor histidine kinase LiaS
MGLPVEQALFRVAQESLANVARHSQAGRVTVSLGNENEEVRLAIEDNGVGFDEEPAAKGVGLDSMRERLDAMGGRLDILSRKGKGTRVIASVRRS